MFLERLAPQQPVPQRQVPRCWFLSQFHALPQYPQTLVRDRLQ
ncbi:Uncharacterised protein [Vibrio cholerae]|nr:Uncharacterised protein [Vibrio cholerae]